MVRNWFIGLLIFVVAAMAAAFAWYYYTSDRTQEEGIEQNTTTTNRIGYAEFETPHADPLLVGKWQNTDNTKWYKVYYDDYDDEYRMFWGKEWDEAEDVTEEDLNYHGNGWFRWEKKGKVIREYATMDTRDVPIHHAYKILFSSADSLCYGEADYRNAVYEFVKAE